MPGGHSGKRGRRLKTFQAHSSQNEGKPMAGKKMKKTGKNPRISRKQFVKAVGITTGAIAAAGLGLSRTAKAQGEDVRSLPVTPNPDTEHIIEISPSRFEVYPIGTTDKYPTPVPDPRISTTPEYADDPRMRTKDAINIEWAVNNVAKNGESPGTVVLKHVAGTPFEFGEWGDSDQPPGNGVLVCNDCIVTGEKNSRGKPLTTIKNGASAFVVNWYLSFIYADYDEGGNWILPFKGPQLWHQFAESFTLKNIVSEDSSMFFVLGYSGSDITDWTPHSLDHAEVDNVKIYRAKPLFPNDVCMPMLFETDYGTVIVKNCHVQAFSSLDPDDPENTGWDFMGGITTTNSMTGPPYSVPVGPRLEATNNVLEIGSSHLGSAGVFLGTAMGAVIKNNTITADLGVVSSDVGWEGGGSIIVKNNKVTARVAGFSVVDKKGASIELLFPPQTIVHPGLESLKIQNNSVKMDSDGSIDLLHGMVAGLIGQGVHFMDLTGGLPLSRIRDGDISGNMFSGNADFGLFLGDFWGWPDDASGNAFALNDFKKLESAMVTVYLGPSTSENTVGPNRYPAGDPVFDEGTDNKIVGLGTKKIKDIEVGRIVRDMASSKKKTGNLRIPKISPMTGFGPRFRRK
jgi:hypothetical protein